MSLGSFLLFSKVFSTHDLGKKILEKNYFPFFIKKSLKSQKNPPYSSFSSSLLQDNFLQKSSLDSSINSFSSLWLLAQEQNNGRGRHGHYFSSPLGGLYLTFLYKPRYQQLPNGLLTSFLTYTGKILLDHHGVMKKSSDHNQNFSPFVLRWKNDIYCGHKKIGGAMIDVETDPEGCPWWIMSLGLNLNSSFSITVPWGSPRDLNYLPMDIFSFFQQFQEKFLFFLKFFDIPGSIVLPEKILTPLAQSFLEYNEEVFLQSPKSWHHGVFKGFTSQGQTLLEEKKNEKKPYDALVLFPALCHYNDMPLWLSGRAHPW